MTLRARRSTVKPARARREPLPSRRGLVRGLVHCGSRNSKAPPVTSEARYRDPALCLKCRSVYHRKTWRRRAMGLAAFDRAQRTVCPACRQVRRRAFHGQVRLNGPLSPDQRLEILRRLRHVLRRAAFTQPERRLVEVQVDATGIDLKTTSQKLAHRIARELEKAFRGRARYAWLDREGLLRAEWTADS